MAKPKKVPSDERIFDLSERLKEICKLKNLKQKDVIKLTIPYSERYGVSIQANEFSQYINGKVIPGFDKLTVLSKALNVSEKWLLGYDVEMVNTENLLNLKESQEKLPLLKEDSSENPVLQDEEESSENYIDIKKEFDFDYCLKVKDDSMKGNHIYKGDIVFIAKQEMPSELTDSLAAFIINGETIIKRIQYYPEKEIYILKSSNSDYSDMIFNKIEFSSITFLGKVVAFLSQHTSLD